MNLLLITTLLSATTIQAAFTDVPSSHVNAEAIMYMQSEGIVKGYTANLENNYQDNTFRPDATINRAEFTKIIVGALTEQVISGCTLVPEMFTDTVDCSWYKPYLQIAYYDMGVINGYADGTFKPDATINFVEAAKIIALSIQSDLKQNTKNDSEWYEVYVQYLADNKAIPITITTLETKITRGEMSEIIYRLLVPQTKPSQSLSDFNTQPTPSNSEQLTPIDSTLYKQNSSGEVWFISGTKNIKIPEIRTQEVSVVNPYIITTNTKVFISGETLRNADPVSFKNITGNYFADKKNAYYMLGVTGNHTAKVLTGDIEHLKTFTQDSKYIADSTNVYFEGRAMKDVDLDSFEIIDWQTETAKDKNGTYKSGLKTVGDASLELLAGGYARDNAYGYYGNAYIPGSDGKTFQAISNDGYNASYAKDSIQAYHLGTPITGSDPNTFTVFDFDYYAKDANFVYSKSDKMPNADGATFTLYPYCFLAKDKNNVYVLGYQDTNLEVIIPNIKPSTFELREDCSGRNNGVEYGPLFYMEYVNW